MYNPCYIRVVIAFGIIRRYIAFSVYALTYLHRSRSFRLDVVGAGAGGNSGAFWTSRPKKDSDCRLYIYDTNT